MSAEPTEAFRKLEMFGDAEAEVCGPDGCELPAGHEAVARPQRGETAAEP